MARPHNRLPSERLLLVVPEQVRLYLDDLVLQGIYGSNSAEVARALILREIQRLIEIGVLQRRPAFEPPRGGPPGRTP